jgi:hypothetical protein
MFSSKPSSVRTQLESNIYFTLSIPLSAKGAINLDLPVSLLLYILNHVFGTHSNGASSFYLDYTPYAQICMLSCIKFLKVLLLAIYSNQHLYHLY